jgi:hypothetical protein
MTTLKVNRVYPIAGNIKYMGAVMENDKHTTIYYSDGYSPDYGHPIEYKSNKWNTTILGTSCVFKS